MAGVSPGEVSSATQQQQAARGEAFGYVCNRCSRCCYDKVIQVNPYEIARLARRVGLDTAAFRAAYTEDGAGVHLTRKADGACSFLGPDGCGVHPDRPLVCRIYPLGRHVAPDGTERWTHLTPHPQTAGVYSKDGRIADYLEAQDAYPFMRATDLYTAWLRRAYEVLGDDPEAEDAGAGPPVADLLDMDGAIAAHCRATGQAEPLDIEARLALHLAILAERLVDFTGEKS